MRRQIAIDIMFFWPLFNHAATDISFFTNTFVNFQIRPKLPRDPDIHVYVATLVRQKGNRIPL